MDQFSFKFDAYGGLGEVRGVLQFDGQRLCLHYQVSDAMFGALRSQPREVEFAPEAVIDARFSAGWFWLMPRVELQIGDVAKIADMPLEVAGQLRLHLPFGQRRAARRLVDSLALVCSERRLRHLDAQLASMGAPPPLPVPPPQAPSSMRAPASPPEQE